MPEGLENYASPILRAAVFRRLFPGAQVSYQIVPMDEAFPEGHRAYEGEATEAVRCEIILDDGAFVISHKEIDRKEGRNARPRAQTPEELVKDETKAFGRALRDLGIPQRLTELKLLMQWIASMEGTPASPPSTSSAATASTPPEAVTGFGDGDDDPDAGAEPTREQVAAEMFEHLPGAFKAEVSKWLRETHGVANALRSGDHADDLIEYIDGRGFLRDEETF